MKYLLIIGDGMADNPVEALEGKTPLEKAKKPFIDSLAKRGELGSVRTVPIGFQPGSDTAIMSIFGCSPAKYFRGRAPLEAAAKGIPIVAGDAAFRCNMMTLSEEPNMEDRVILSHSAGGIGGEEARALCEDLIADPDYSAALRDAGVTIYPDDSYRHLAVMKGADITGIVAIPPHDHLGEKALPHLPHGCESAAPLARLTELSYKFLARHPINEKRRAEGKLPANSVWFWAEGTAAALPDFTEQFGKTGAVVSAVPLCHGIATLAKLDVIKVDGATGELDTNYEGKVEAALGALKTRDFAAVHIEAPDECTHNGDLEGKLLSIEFLDTRVTRPLIRALEQSGEPFRVLILSDHKTLTEGHVHDGDPVPYIIYDSRGGAGSGLPYTEKNAENGPFVEDAAAELMKKLFAVS